MDDAPKRDKPDEPRLGLRSLLNAQILVTLPTLVISIALAYFAFVQADASRKMQRTETWPYVSYGTDNSSPEVKDEISFSLSNDGVGPARLEEMEFLYGGRPMSNPIEFIRDCCTADKTLVFTTDRVDGVLRPGENRKFIRLAKSDENVATWERLNKERWKVVVRTCYCSIFDDCWVFDSSKTRPDPVKACPADWLKFAEQPNPSPART
ncbi:MAG TPA: hypothetical protein VGM04_07670 [Sphingomicrobium sp.]|jgi:hypothetical protein